jgi:hypothetical protein
MARTRVSVRVRSVTLAFAALLVLLVLPGPVVADTCACDPIQPYLVTDRYNETHVVYRHATSPGLIYASNKSESWVKRRLTSAKDEPYAIGVDAAQKVYIVFRRESGDEVHFHLITNRTGEWVRTRLSIVQDDVYRVRIAIDGDRRVHLAFDRDEAIFYATNVGGSWTRTRLDRALGSHANLALDAANKVHLAFNACETNAGPCGTFYRTNASGSWVTTHATGDGSEWVHDIAVATGGVHIVYGREYESPENPALPLGTFYLTNQGGTWRSTWVAAPGRWANIERSRLGAITVVFSRVDDDDRRGIYMATNASGAWVRSTIVREWAMYPSTGIGPSGVVHLAYMRMTGDPGIYYSRGGGDGWSRRELMD